MASKVRFTLVAIGCCLSLPAVSFSHAQEAISFASVSQSTEPTQVPQSDGVNLIQLAPLPESKRCPVVTAMAIDPTTETLAAAGDDHAIRWIDLRTGKSIAVLEGHEDWVRKLVFLKSPDDKLALLSCGDDGKLFLWQWELSEQIPSVSRNLMLQRPHTLTSLATDSTGSVYATGGFSHDIYIGSTTNAKDVKQVRCDCGDQRAFVFAPNDQTLFAGGRDGMIHVIDVNKAEIVGEKQVHRSRLRSLAIDQDGTTLSSVGEDRILNSIDLQSDEVTLTTQLRAGKLLAVEHLDASRLAIASADNTVQIVDAKTGEEINKLVGHDGSVAVLLYENDRLFTAGFDTTIRMWDLNNLQSTNRATKLIRHPIYGKFMDSGVSETAN